MATTRKIKEAKDLSSGELIYFKGHAKATYMTDGRTVEDAINNINQSGNGGGTSSGSGAYGLVEHGTTDTTFSLTPNTFHVWDEVTELTLTFEEETTGVANEYLFQFTSGTEPTVLTLPNDIVWANDEIPVIESEYIYQVSILKGFATLMKFVKPLIINFPYTVTDGKNHSGLYNYLISKYNINSSTSDSPNSRVEINEIIIVEDNSYGGEVLGISLYNGNLLLWTQNAIELEWEVMYINVNGDYGGYIYE